MAGLATLLIVAAAVVRLPGAGVTAAVLVGALVLGSAVFASRFLRAGVRDAARPLATMALTLLAAVVPFVAYQRFGALGVLDNSDLASHLVLVEALRTGDPALGFPESLEGYPSGPHSMVGVLATVLGTDILTAFNGLLLAIPMLTALAALAGLREGPAPARVAAAVCVGLPYLCAAYLVQAAFKETLEALLVLAFVLTLREIARDGAWSMRSVLPLALLSAGSVLTYGAVGLAWLGAVVGCWAIAQAASRRPLPSRRQALLGLGAVAAVGMVATAPHLLDLIEFSRSARVAAQEGSGGNVPADPSVLEVFGLWARDDFRASEHPFSTGLLGGIALMLALASLAWWRSRGDLAVPAGVVGCLLVYAGALAVATPYSATKGLVIAAPLALLLIVGYLVARSFERGEGGDIAARVAHGAAALAFVVGALWSSSLVLRNARVGPRDHAVELSSLRPLVDGKATLFLGRDDFIIPELRGARVSFDYVYSGESAVGIVARPEKPFLLGAPRDFDSVDPATLDRFEYVVTPRTAYASAPPSNWLLRKSTRSYHLFERRGETLPRQVLNEGATPGALLDCADPIGRRLSESGGTAAVRPAPIIGSPRGWAGDGGPLPEDRLGFAVTAVGRTATHPLRLPPGRWDISLQYVSPTPLRVRAPHLDTTLPASLDPGDQFWSVGTVLVGSDSGTFSIRAGDLPALATKRAVAVGAIVATSGDIPPRMVDLADACGAYVDWYRLPPPG